MAIGRSELPRWLSWTCEQFKQDLAAVDSHYLVLQPMEAFVSYRRVLDEAEIFNLAVLPEKKDRDWETLAASCYSVLSICWRRKDFSRSAGP